MPTTGFALIYIVLYLALDRISFIEALHGVDITPWNPPAGLTLALLMVEGLGFLPAALAAVLLSSQLMPLVHVPLTAGLAAAAVVAAGYAAAAAVLRRFLVGETWLQDVRDTVLFLFVSVAASGAVAVGFIAAYAAAGVVPWSEFREAAFRFWTGDAIGIVVLTPLLLVLVDGAGQFLIRTWHWRRLLEFAAQWSAIIIALALVFGFPEGYAFRLFYLLFLPLVWVAARHGLPGASAAILTIQVGLIAALEFQDRSPATVLAFQLLMFAVATTGLLLGAAVSERRRVGRALAESQGRLAAIVNTARDGMLTIDANGVIQSANPAVDRIFRYPTETLIGCDVRRLLAAPDLLDRLTAIASPSGGDAVPWELEARRVDGTAVPVEVTIGRLGATSDDRYTLVVRDITLRRQAEARARAHQTELAHVARVSLAGEMASALAHELNQPLTSITTFGRGCMRLLRQGPSEPHLLQDGIDEIVQQAERASDIISWLREFLRTGSYEVTTCPIDAIVNSAVTLAGAEAAQNGIELAIEIAPDLPPVKVDRIQIEQVLLNLLRNAMDAIGGSERQQRVVRIDVRRKAGPAVEVTVSDTGPGLADDVASRMFEPFVTTKANGMGLGLSISRSIVEAQGGRLRLIRSSDIGAVFAFELPALPATNA